ncbi:hypothetical protein [Dokdonella sp.]|uniref:hypothetical protein n=1 Tax=Dokdonella sp. TaxID=2291710 RepID=UPI00352745AD
MSAVTTTFMREYLRRDAADSNGDPLEDVLQLAINTAEGQAEAFMGVALVDLTDSDGALPAPIVGAIAILTQVEFDELQPDREHMLRGRAESLLRPYRVETGIAGGADE